MLAMPDYLQTALQENGYTIAQSTQQQFIAFLKLLQKWNQVFNLTAITTPREMIYLHLLDSLAVYPYLTGNNFLDVGSGGGLPGIPLAIIDPKKNWLLLDKSQKKTRFLTQVIAELGLKNVTVECSRCEAFQSPGCFDTIISRAFGTIALLVTTTQHLICPKGQFLAMKGSYPREEIAALPADFELVGIDQLSIRGLAAERHLIRIKRKYHD